MSDSKEKPDIVANTPSTSAECISPASTSDKPGNPLKYSEVTVEYIKENDFRPRPKKKYAPRSVHKSIQPHGAGYYVPGKSSLFVRGMVGTALSSNQGQDQEKAVLREVPVTLREEWQKLLSQGKRVTCGYKKCKRFFSSPFIFSHYTKCEGNQPGEEFTCEDCGKQFIEETGVFGHMTYCAARIQRKAEEQKKEMLVKTETGEDTCKEEEKGQKDVASRFKQNHDCGPSASDKSEEMSVPVGDKRVRAKNITSKEYSCPASLTKTAASSKQEQKQGQPIDRNKMVVEDTIKSLIDLFGERKKERATGTGTPDRGASSMESRRVSARCSPQTPKTRLGAPVATSGLSATVRGIASTPGNKRTGLKSPSSSPLTSSKNTDPQTGSVKQSKKGGTISQRKGDVPLKASETASKQTGNKGDTPGQNKDTGKGKATAKTRKISAKASTETDPVVHSVADQKITESVKASMTFPSEVQEKVPPPLTDTISINTPCSAGDTFGDVTCMQRGRRGRRRQGRGKRGRQIHTGNTDMVITIDDKSSSDAASDKAIVVDDCSENSSVICVGKTGDDNDTCSVSLESVSSNNDICLLDDVASDFTDLKSTTGRGKRSATAGAVVTERKVYPKRDRTNRSGTMKASETLRVGEFQPADRRTELAQTKTSSEKGTMQANEFESICESDTSAPSENVSLEQLKPTEPPETGQRRRGRRSATVTGKEIGVDLNRMPTTSLDISDQEGGSLQAATVPQRRGRNRAAQKAKDNEPGKPVDSTVVTAKSVEAETPISTRSRRSLLSKVSSPPQPEHIDTPSMAGPENEETSPKCRATRHTRRTLHDRSLTDSAKIKESTEQSFLKEKEVSDMPEPKGKSESVTDAAKNLSPRRNRQGPAKRKHDSVEEAAGGTPAKVPRKGPQPDESVTGPPAEVPVKGPRADESVGGTPANVPREGPQHDQAVTGPPAKVPGKSPQPEESVKGPQPDDSVTRPPAKVPRKGPQADESVGGPTAKVPGKGPQPDESVKGPQAYESVGGPTAKVPGKGPQPDESVKGPQPDESVCEEVPEPTLDASSATAETQDEHTPIKPKRKRGRPPKLKNTPVKTPVSDSGQVSSEDTSVLFKTPTSVRSRRKRAACDTPDTSGKRPRLSTDSEDDKTPETQTDSYQPRRRSARVAVPKRFFDSVDEFDDEDSESGINIGNYKEDVTEDNETSVSEMESETGESEVEENTPGKRGRRGRRRGRGRISRGGRKISSSEVKEEEDTDPNEMFTCVHCPDGDPMAPNDIKHHMMRYHIRIWSRSDPEGTFNPLAVLKRLREIHCPKCDKTFKYTSYFSYHLKWCGKEMETLTCNLCEKAIRKMHATQHLRTVHKILQKIPKTPSLKEESEGEVQPQQSLGSGVKRKAAQRARASFQAIINDFETVTSSNKHDDSSDDPDAVIHSDDDVEAEDEEFADVGVPCRSGSLPKSKYPNYTQRLPGQETLEVFDEAMPWTFNWKQKYGQKIVFPHWTPKAESYRKLTAQEAELYLPEAQWSPWFAAYHRNEEIRPPQRLKRFEVTPEPVGAYLNAGGPVWALAWCPTPLGEESTQYLAVSAHRKHDTLHPLLQSKRGPGAIQFWDCGTLLDSNEAVLPRIKMILTHDSGAIWCMKWCPCGAWQEDESDDGTLRRIGLLATATSSGYIHIYSVPDPSTLSTEGDDLPVYHTEPVVSLQPQPLHSTDSLTTGCLSFDWQYSNGCCRLVAGYGNGRVAMWDLTTASDLLRRTCPETGTEFLQPFHSFQAHLAGIKGIAFCQKKPQFFVTGSKDRYMKIWDSRNTEVPLNMMQKSEYTQIEWPLHWPTIFGASDDCYNLEHNSVQSMDTGYFGLYLRPMTVHNACINGLSYSEWLNTLVSVDTAGEVLAMYLPIMLLIYKHHKSFTWRRWLLYSTEVKPLPGCQCRLPGGATSEQAAEQGGATAADVTGQGSATTDIDPTALIESATGTCPKCGKPRSPIDSKSDLEDISPTTESPTNGKVDISPTTESPANGKVDISPTTESPANGKVDNEESLSDRSEKNSETGDANNEQSLETLSSSQAAIDGVAEACRQKPKHTNVPIQTMKGMIEKYCVVYRDIKINQLNRDRNNKLSFASQLRPDILDQPALSANNRVLWNPNLGSHYWLAIVGEAGLIRLMHLSAFKTQKGTEFVKRTFRTTQKEKEKQ